MPSSPSTPGNPSPPPPPPQQPPSTTITTITTTPTPPPPRKFPAPCWTQDETLALIHAYQDKWYSLRRRNLRTADWEAVADEVNRRCPNQSPPKSSAQCRHKMEKLRKRYRAEKQRISSLPYPANTRFFPSSSWVFFDLMDSMEVGPGSGPTLGPGPGPGPVEKEVVNFAVSKGKDDLNKYFEEILMGKSNSNHNHSYNHGSNINNNNNNNYNNINNNNVIPMKIKVKNQSLNHGERYFEDGYDYNENRSNGNGGFVEYDDDNKSGRSFYGFSGNKRKMGGEMGFNGGGMTSSRKGKEAVVAEMAASIKMLGEGLIKMETMKMEMMQEIEKRRMEMEMKRNEMMLESQHAIVHAFLQGLKKHKKVKAMQHVE